MSSPIAIFHENYAQNGGAERVAESMARMLPQADLLSTVTVDCKLSPYLRDRGVRTTWMQRLPRLDRWYRHYVALYPVAVRGTSTRQYALLLSSCFGFAKGLRRPRAGLHVCYCHTPPRWIWRAEDYMARERWNPAMRSGLRAMNRLARAWDLFSAEQPDVLVANSAIVAERLFCFYGREATVIHPPIELDRFHLAPGAPEPYFLVVSRLVGYKRIDLAIQASNQLGRRLKIIGDGPDRGRLEGMAGETVEFLGRLSDAEVEHHLARCQALLFPGEEDFGLTPLETNASGRPVVAFGAGGALETVIDGETGVLFPEPSADSLARAMLRLEAAPWDAHALRQHAAKFRTEIFHDRLRALLVGELRRRGLDQVAAEIERADAA